MDSGRLRARRRLSLRLQRIALTGISILLVALVVLAVLDWLQRST